MVHRTFYPSKLLPDRHLHGFGGPVSVDPGASKLHVGAYLHIVGSLGQPLCQGPGGVPGADSDPVRGEVTAPAVAHGVVGGTLGRPFQIYF